MATIVFLDKNSTSPWSKPGGFTDGNNKVEGIGAGGNGFSGDTVNGNAGAGAGAYAKSTNLTLSGNPAFVVGAGGSQIKTQFRDSSTLVADCGTNAATGGVNGTGGLVANCVTVGTGAVAYAGGAGKAATGNFFGRGGGGSGGPNGAGSAGTGTGGDADNHTVTGPASGAGISGTEFDGTHGCGTGAANSGSATANGFAGGQYGGGGSGAGITSGAAGTGGDGLLIVTYPLSSGSPFGQARLDGIGAGGNFFGNHLTGGVGE